MAIRHQRSARLTVVVLGTIIASLAATSASAQILDQAPRMVRGLFGGGPPPDPNRTRQELTFDGSLLGGYDDNFTPTGGDPTQMLLTGESSASTFADAGLKYWRGRTARSFEVEGRGYTTRYSALDNGVNIGGNLRGAGSAMLGRRDRFDASAALRSDPLMTLGGFGALQPAEGTGTLPAASPLQGLTDSRTLSMLASASLRHDWSRRWDTTAGYDFNRSEYSGNTGYDSRSQTVHVVQDYRRTRRLTLRGNYAHSASTFTGTVGVTPLDNDVIQGGFAYDRALSPTRHLSFAATAGATYVSTVNGVNLAPLKYWAPSASGNSRIDIGRSWAVWADYSRGATVLESISPEVFFSDSVLARTGGLVGSRLDLTFSGGYSNGQTSSAGPEGRYETFLTSAQASVALSRCCAMVAQYTHYHYTLHNVLLPAGFPPDFDRNTVRAGLQLYLPLYSSYLEGAGRRPGAGSRQP